MADHVTPTQAKWGWAMEAANVDDATESTVGIPNDEANFFKPNQTFTTRASGQTVEATGATIAETFAATWAPGSTMFLPTLGQWAATLCQSAVETESGPYLQTIQPDISSGKAVDSDDAIVAGSLLAGTVWQAVGQTGSRDIAGAVIVDRLDFTFPKSGAVTVTPNFMFITYDNAADASTTPHVFTLPGVSSQIRAQDVHYYWGTSQATGTALYSDEVSFSLIADIGTPKRYGGRGANGLPYRIVFNGWSVEGTVQRPLPVAGDSWEKDYLVNGGEVDPNDSTIVIQSSSLALVTTALTADQTFRIILNVRPESVELADDDETIEKLTFRGTHDGTIASPGTNIFELTQMTTGTQAAWCS